MCMSGPCHSQCPHQGIPMCWQSQEDTPTYFTQPLSEQGCSGAVCSQTCSQSQRGCNDSVAFEEDRDDLIHHVPFDRHTLIQACWINETKSEDQGVPPNPFLHTVLPAHKCLLICRLQHLFFPIFSAVPMPSAGHRPPVTHAWSLTSLW